VYITFELKLGCLSNVEDLLVTSWVDIRHLYGLLCVVTCDVWTILPLELYPLCITLLWLSCVW